MSATAIAPWEFGQLPRRDAGLPLVALSGIPVLACPRGCDAERVPCKAATVVRRGADVCYTPHVEQCARAGART